MIFATTSRQSTLRFVSGAETWQYDAIGRVINHASDLGAFQLSYLGQTQQLIARQLLPATSTLKTVWSYLDNTHDRRLVGIANTGLSNGQFTNFIFQTTPENFVTGITQTSDTTVAETRPPAQTVSFNDLNEITSVDGQAYSYDSNGNMLSDGQHTYSWDAENRLIGVTYPLQPGKKTIHTYDGLGRRIEIDETPSGGGIPTISKYVWCDITCVRRDSNYSISKNYVSEGEYIVNSTNSIYYGIDQLGSVRRAFESATISATLDFDPWGSALTTSEPITDFGYAGMFTKANLGLTWFRAYAPIVGRWLSRDPLFAFGGGSNNLYAYAQNDPVDWFDPTGEARKRRTFDPCPNCGNPDMAPNYCTPSGKIACADCLIQEVAPNGPPSASDRAKLLEQYLR